VTLLTTIGYSDFKAVESGFKDGRGVFYTTTPTTFYIYIIANNGDIINSNNLGVKPATFDTDYPKAIQLQNGITFT
jgi:hypothetical protein